MALKHLMYSQVLLSLVVYRVIQSSTLSTLANVSCIDPCICKVDANGRLSAKCNLEGINVTEMSQFYIPQALHSLDLSSSGLKQIPSAFLRQFPNITFLSLANNSLKDTKKDALDSLMKLQILDLSNTELYMLPNLPSLQELFVNKATIADPWYWFKFLNLSSIANVYGVDWARSCDFCNITKSNAFNMSRSALFNSSKMRMVYYKGRPFHENAGEICLKRYVFGWNTYFFCARSFLKSGYLLECVCDQQDCVMQNPPLQWTLVLRLIQMLLDGLYPIAAVALVLNLAVILLTLTSKEFSKSTTLLLILNMAVCDLLMAVYCILCATFNVYFDSDEEVADTKHINAVFYTKFESLKAVCPYLAFLFGVTQCTSFMTSLLLTMERYLLIVYYMKLTVRLTRRFTLICLGVTWCVAIAYNICFLLATDFKLSYSFLCSSSGPNVNISSLKMRLSSFLGVFSIILFLCTIPLYIQMYLVVRNSSARTGVKREGNLMRKITLVLVTNLLFGSIPPLLVQFVDNGIWARFYMEMFMESYTSFKTYMICTLWLPLLLLCFNSCLNPVLFPFKHYLVKRRLRQIFYCLLNFRSNTRVSNDNE